MSKHVVITGGAGFVGINLSCYLKEKGYSVTIIDFSDRINRLNHVSEKKGYRFNLISMDLIVAEPEIPERTDFIIHLAAWPHVDFSYYYPGITIQNNIISLTNVLNVAVRRNIPVIFSSSVEVYGGIEEKEYRESDALCPVSPYGASKHACESIIKTYQRCYNLKAIVYRLTNLYGPYQLPDRIVPRLITRLLNHTNLDVESNVVRDFVFIDDAVKAIEKIMTSGKWGEVYNISTGYGTTMGSIAEYVLEEYGQDVSVKNLMDQIDKQRGKNLVIIREKITRDLGWVPEVDVRKGIAETYTWYKNNIDWWLPMKSCFMSDRSSSRFVVDCLNNPQVSEQTIMIRDMA